MSQNQQKQRAAQAALEYLPYDGVIGVGTGSTVAYFIEALADKKGRIEAAVASSVDTATKLKALGIEVIDLNQAKELSVYIDGADEVNQHGYMIKGGGAALTREKIIAAVADKFVCIVDESKHVDVLGKFPLPVEVIPMARSYVARELMKLGGDPVYRQGCITDNGNVILDVHNLDLLDPIKAEQAINNITGVVSNGLFCQRGANTILLGHADSVETIQL